MADNGYYNQNENTQVQEAVNAALKEQKKKKKKKWLIIIGVIVALFIIAAIASGGDDDTTTDTTNTVAAGEEITVEDDESKAEETTEESSDDTQESVPSKIEAGYKVTIDDLDVSYVSCNANFKDYNEYLGPKDGNKVIQAKFKFKNNGDRDAIINGTECYADDVKCDLFFGTDDADISTVDTISAGRETEAVMYYEVPEDAKDIEIEMESDWWTSEKLIFVVK